MKYVYIFQLQVWEWQSVSSIIIMWVYQKVNSASYMYTSQGRWVDFLLSFYQINMIMNLTNESLINSIPK